MIWRGHFNASGDETAFSLTVQGGYGFGFSAWFNGVFLGSSQGNATISQTSVTWPIPNGTLATGKDNVLVILQGKFIGSSLRMCLALNSVFAKDHMGLVQSTRKFNIACYLYTRLTGPKANAGKEPRGIRGYSILGGSTTFSIWKLAGHLVSQSLLKLSAIKDSDTTYI